MTARYNAKHIFLVKRVFTLYGVNVPFLTLINVKKWPKTEALAVTQCTNAKPAFEALDAIIKEEILTSKGTNCSTYLFITSASRSSCFGLLKKFFSECDAINNILID